MGTSTPSTQEPSLKDARRDKVLFINSQKARSTIFLRHYMGYVIKAHSRPIINPEHNAFWAGTLWLASGWKYVGDWFNKRMHGPGRAEWPNGAVYQGKCNSQY